MKRSFRISTSFVIAVLTLALPVLVLGQQPPIGGHLGGRGEDSGGGYPESVALDLPKSHGGLPAPVSVIHSCMRMGAAEKGWDLPLSSVHEHTAFAHRRPPESVRDTTSSLDGDRVAVGTIA